MLALRMDNLPFGGLDLGKSDHGNIPGSLPTDLRPKFPQSLFGVLRIMIRPPKLDRLKSEFSGFDQGDWLAVLPNFVSVIGTLLPIAR